MLSEASIEKFKRIFKEDYGVEYSDEETREAANNPVGFFNLLLKIDRDDKKNLI